MKIACGLILAMPIEAYALLGWRGWKWGKAFSYRRERPDHDLELICVCSGSGKNSVLHASHWLISKGASSLILLGMSGGLRPGVRAGDTVVADSIIETTGKGAYSCWKTAPAIVSYAHEVLMETDLSCYRGPIVTGTAPLINVDAKKDLFVQTRALAVDMESAAAARAADEAGVPFFILRAVCDGAGTSLPVEISRCFDGEGKFQWRPLIESIWEKPFFLLEMFAMAKNCIIALHSLKRAWRLQLKAGLPRLLASGSSNRKNYERLYS